MTLLFMDGFDTQDTALKWTSFNGSTSATTRFSSGASVVLASDANTMKRPFTAMSQIFVGFAHRQGSTGGAAGEAFFALYGDGGTTMHIDLRWIGTQLQLWRGYATMLAYVDGLLLPATWNYLEVSATIDDSTGSVTVKCNNTTVMTFSGDTKNGGTNTTIDAVRFGGQLGGGNTYIDDVYVCNSSGSVNNTFLGDTRIQTCSPNGAGSSTALTPTGSGTNYLNVNEIPDNTATYNGSSTSTDRDTYALANLASGTGTIYAVQQVMSAFKTGAGSASMKGAQKSGATVSYGATQSLGTSPAVYLDVFETNPATSAAYTATEVNALEAGAEVV